jgi:hypothetical protein
MAIGLLSLSHAHAPAKPHAESVAEPVAGRVEEVAQEEAPSYTPVRVYDEPAPAVETREEYLPAAEPLAVAPEAEPITPEPELTEAEPTTAESISPEPFSQPAPASAEPAGPPVAARRRHGAYDAALPVEVSDEEEKRQHHDARRFARLLVSEIKLYNEQKVVEGRAQGNLYERLREYIDRSREMYDKRVKTDVSARYDYFHHELINTLAEGDASKLGEAYPGAAVSA